MKLRFDKRVHPISTTTDGLSIRSAKAKDYAFWKRILNISRLEFGGRMVGGTAFVLTRGDEYAGLLYHTVLWDSIPMLNMVFVRKSMRAKGAGTFAVSRWEALMRARGFRAVLVCVPSDMIHQNFYRRRGYVDCGSINLDLKNRPTPSDLFLVKYFD